MSVTGMNSRMAMAEKLSIPQLQQAIQTGSVPAYVGIPLLQEKMKMQKSMQAMGQQQGEQPTVAEQVLQEAQQSAPPQMQQRMAGPGIDQLPSNLPTYDNEEFGEESYAGGGIVAFAGRDESLVRDEADRNPRITALRSDPAYLAFVENGGDRGDTSLTAFLEAGNTPRTTASGPDYEPAPATSPAGDFARSVFDDVRSRFRAMPNQEQRNEMRDLGVRSGIFGVGSDASRAQAEKELRERLYGTQSTPVTTLPTTVVTAGRDPAFAMEDTAGTTYTPPPKGAGGVGTGQGTRGAGGAPAASQPAQAAQAPAAQPEAKSALDKYAEMLMAERAGSGKAREQAQAMALLQAGLGIMGGTSPNALANIAQGALPATQAYQQEIKGIRAEDAARMKELMGLGISKEKLELEAKKLGISEKRFDQMYELEKQKIGIMGGQRADSAKTSEALRRDQLAKGYFDTLLKQNPMATPQELDAMEATARRLAGAAAAPTQSTENRYAGFSIVK